MPLVKADGTPSNPVKSPDRDIPREILRDQHKRPLIVTPDGDVRPYTRASSMGGVLEDQTGLGIWRMRQVAWGVGHSRSLRLRAQTVQTTSEPTDKRELGRIAWDAMDFADSSAAAQVGTAIHALTEQYDAGRPLPDLDDAERPALEVYAEFIQHFTVHAMETFVVADELEAAGTFDRLLSPKYPFALPCGIVLQPEDRIIDDLKTSSTSAYLLIKPAVQELIYAHGTPYRGWIDRDELERQGYDRELSLDELQRLPLKVKVAISRGERLPWPDGLPPRQDRALIMHIPSGWDPARLRRGAKPEECPGLYAVDLELGLELARLARTVQKWRARKDLVARAELPRSTMSTALNGAGLASLIDAVDPPTPEAFNALWAQHKSAWTAEHTARARARTAVAS
jgi:hypothetical protein